MLIISMVAMKLISTNNLLEKEMDQVSCGMGLCLVMKSHDINMLILTFLVTNCLHHNYIIWGCMAI